MKRTFFPVFTLSLAVVACAAEARTNDETACLRVQNGKGAAYAVVSLKDAGHVLEWYPDGSATNRFWKSPFPDRLLSEWRNTGGERTWIGPQSSWQAIFGTKGDWPPPAFLEEEAGFERTPDSTPLQGSLTIQTKNTRPLDCVRTISLAPDGTLSVQASFRPNPEPGTTPLALMDFQIWSIAQLPVPLSAKARLSGEKRIGNGILGKDPIVPEPARDKENKTIFFDLANIRLSPNGGGKCFLDADAFVLAYPDGTLTITQTESAPLPNDTPPYRAQLFCGWHPDIPGPQGRYIEVEFAGRADSPMTVRFQWQPAGR